MSAEQREELMEQAKGLLVKGMINAEKLSRAVVAKYQNVRNNNEDLDDHCGIAGGVILTLFGGQFATTFAFAEAFQQSGWKDLVENGRIIQDQLGQAKKAVELDDLVDDNHDGTPDVHQISPRALAERKFQVFIKNVDPEIVNKALSALWLSFLSASAAVKLKFARVIALGASVGEFIEKPVQKYLLPKLMEMVDPKYHRWLPNILNYICRLIGVSIAFRLNRVLATVSTSIRGGELLLASINSLCVKRKMQFLTAGPADEMLAMSLVGAGIYAQLFGPQSSILLRILLFPLSITENLLTLWVAS